MQIAKDDKRERIRNDNLVLRVLWEEESKRREPWERGCLNKEFGC